MRIALLCCWALAFGTPAIAQSPGPVQHYTAAQLRDAVASADTARSGMAGKMLGERGGYSYLVLRRDQTGQPEVHQAWDDLIVVESGAATLLHGGTVTGGRQTAPGELRGGEISGGATQPIAAGDVVVIPAGVPHQVVLARGQSVTYVVVKAQATHAEAAPARP